MFVILVFVIALVKLGIDVTLFAQKIDWKDKFVKEVNYHYQTQQIKNAEIAARDVEIETRGQYISILTDRINTLDTENSAKAARIEQISRQLDAANTLNTRLEADLQVFTRQLEVQLAQIQELTTKVEEHRAKLAKALNEKGLLAAEVQYARQQAERLQHDLAQLEEKHVEMARDKKHLEEKINHLNQLGYKTDVAPKKPLEAKVTAVANEIGLVVISIGKDDGVLEGDEFTVYRAGDFVAKIVIDRSDRKWSAGKVVLKKTDPRVSDDVSNHIFVSAPRSGGGR
jgi:myosin heavy subunit